MTLLKKILDNLQDKNQYFLITSHGQTATLWLAIHLNAHPSIFCTHSYYYPLIEPLQKLDMQKKGFSFSQNIDTYFWKLSLKKFLQQHKQATNKTVVGNVHAFHIGRLLSMQSSLSYRQRKKLRIVNMIRHPITRLESARQCWWGPSADKLNVAVPAWINADFSKAHHLTDFVKKNDSIDFSLPKNRVFVVALAQAQIICQEAQLAEQYHIPNFKHEDITQNKQTFVTLVEYILNQSVFALPYFDEIFQTEKVNQHSDENDLSPQAIFERWEPWQKRLFSYVCQQEKFELFYQKHKYDLSFCIA